ncbi:Tripartite motif-containing protein 2 [Toxocara canis]|uniref:Tripartite motif-containing protein 2 n=1 Tax=Toxocara canis TaxID=6265 RepID=A0A0B2VYF2_TOXCA|nr:Tripartite motif-containing protein 2 [Toxocara canis]
MASTLVETVNINLEDFSESFLTCATCLCTYDQEKRKAKLLPCSHTVCLRCLERMAQMAQVLETGVMRCPMCREMAMLPAGGVVSFPSSFLINQLLDLMQKQRRDVVPNCSVHQQEQLLYCEACDLVFCLHCDAPSTRSCSEHTVVPFSIAIKRMSEIVVFKAKQCVASLNTAAANVECETIQLDKNVDKIVDELNSSFQEVSQLVENRRRELLDSVRVMRDQKRKVLRDQMEMIDAHRKRLERELESCQVDVREMGARTKRVMAATEESLTLTEPRENAFLKLHIQPNTLLQEMEKCLSQFGAISGSTTFPGQCIVELNDSASVHTETRLLLTTFDVDGKRRSGGGDPVKAEVCKSTTTGPNDEEPIKAVIRDNDNGTYTILFRVCESGEYVARVTIFGRSIKNSPFPVSVSAHHSPKWQFGSFGSGSNQLNQPVKICQDPKGYMYILDTGNNRIKLLDGSGEFIDDIRSVALKGASTVGMAILPSGDILTLNWRTKEVTKCNHIGDPLQVTFLCLPPRSGGGDPVKAEVCKSTTTGPNDEEPIKAVIRDNDNGTYTILFRVCESGEYVARVTIFGRSIKNSPFPVSVSAHHSPKWQFGSFGSGSNQLNQPVKICQDPKGYMYILDTGNNRIKLLDGSGEFIDDIRSVALKGASTVGMAILPSGDILTLNWRTKEVTKCNHIGDPLQTMSFSEFTEPIDICADSRGRLLIADTACAKVFVFDAAFRPLFSFDVSAHCDSSPITCVCVGLNDEILVGTCSSLLLFDGGGRFIREIPLSASPQRSRIMAAACAVCPTTGNVIVAVVDSKKNRAHLAVCQYKGSFMFSMDSYGSRLRRPCGLCIGTHKWAGMCFVVDSATHSIKAYQFK